VPSHRDNAQLASDAQLITRVRAGDRGAFADLYSRHAGAASGLAHQFARSASEADDLVSEAFARVLDGMLEGKGTDTAFRAYLFTTLRNTAYDRTRKDKRLQFTDDIESHDVAVQGDDPVIADLESGFIGKAFAGLPERWQTVLWHLQVEGQSAAEVGVLLGMAPNAVSSLAFRAREGLREAYLQAHLAETAAERCRTTVDRLGAWTRGGLSKREKAQVDAHLDECERCTALAVELTEINSGLRGLLAPLLLGGAATGYLATLGPVAPLAQLGTLGAGTVVGGSAGTGGQAALGGSTGARHSATAAAKAGNWGPVTAIGGAVTVAAVVIVGIVLALTAANKAPNTAGDRGSVASTLPAAAGANGGANGGGNAGNGSGGNAGNGSGGNAGNGSGGNAGNGSGGNGPGGTGSGGNGPGGTGPDTHGPGTNGPGTNGSSGTGPGANGPGGTGPGTNGQGGTGPSETGPGTNGSGGTAPGANGPGVAGTGAAGGPSSGVGTGVAGLGPILPGQLGFYTPPNTAVLANPVTPSTGTSSTAAAPTGTASSGNPQNGVPVVPSSANNSTVSGSPGTDSPNSPSTQTVIPPLGPTASATGSSAATTASPATTISATGSTPATSNSLPTTPSSTTSATTGSTSTTGSTTSSVTAPAPLLEVTAGSTVSSGLLAGGSGVLTVELENSGGGPSASGQLMVVAVPPGFALDKPTLAAGLRRSSSAFVNSAASAPSCGPSGLRTITCALPAIAARQTLRITFGISTDPTAINGSIEVSVGGTGPSSIPVTVASGYKLVTLRATPLATRALNAVTLTAVTEAGVTDPGSLAIPMLIAPKMSIVRIVSATTGGAAPCAATADAFVCTAAAAVAGLQLQIQVEADAQSSGTAPVRDEGGRATTPTNTLDVAASTVSGYRSVFLVGPGHLLRAGSTDKATLRINVLPGVLDIQPIRFPTRFAGDLTVFGPLTGCTVAIATVVCIPTHTGETDFTLQFQVSSAAIGPQVPVDATVGNVPIPIQPDPAKPLSVDPKQSGYQSITLTAISNVPLQPGAVSALRLTAASWPNVTAPGPITLQLRLSTGLRIATASGCTNVAETFVCQPNSKGQVAATLTVVVLPTATTANSFPVRVLLDGGRSQLIGAGIAIAPRTAGKGMSLVGPFGANMAGAQTLECATGPSRRACAPDGKLVAATVPRTITTGSTNVISAVLTWAAGSPADVLDTDGNSLNTVTVTIDGVSAVVTGAPPSGVSDTVGKLYVRAADLLDYPVLAARLSVAGSHTVIVTDLRARKAAALRAPMAAWSLTSIWLSPDLTTRVVVRTSNANQALIAVNDARGKATLVEKAAAGKAGAVTDLWFTVWAPDPTAQKKLSFGGLRDVSLSVTGVEPGNPSIATGYEIVHPSLDTFTSIDRQQAAVFTDRPPGDDDLWIGPVLVIRSVA